MIPSTLRLENEKILLRPLSEQDFVSLQKLCKNPEMWTWFTQDLSTECGFLEWAKPAMDGQRLQFSVVEKTSGELVGSTAFGNFSSQDKRLEIGWTWLGEAFHGTGINKEMKLLMLDYCFEKLALERVEIKTDVLNLPARYALKKLGAVEEGILRSHTLMTKGRRRDTIYYSILPQEWKLIKSQNRI
ncbi:GNAT family N-acetyltransferase [Algoriphagus machipongonensis]|uniref:Toxin-antitoxin system, toxin component, GNAT family n=1 Tax=Algoriphagus machipongonensis TaxID=388413 RepID=A3HRT5_9BACT|nr:GNAT family protein [Algoriphagus machipongonensis]EAZ82553.1 toxin-antitoxin system, toxin component, GNAT family [Algoriphagus machipongonensis]